MEDTKRRESEDEDRVGVRGRVGGGGGLGVGIGRNKWAMRMDWTSPVEQNIILWSNIFLFIMPLPCGGVRE